MKEEVKRSASKGENEKRDQYTVVLEDLRSHFKAFRENLGFVRKDVSDLRTDLNEVRTDLNEVRTDLNEVRNDLNEVRNDLNEVRTDLNEVRTDLKVVKKTVESHTEMIGRIMIDVEEIKSGMREKVDRNEFNKLEKRLVILEATIFGGKKMHTTRRP